MGPRYVQMSWRNQEIKLPTLGFNPPTPAPWSFSVREAWQRCDATRAWKGRGGQETFNTVAMAGKSGVGGRGLGQGPSTVHRPPLTVDRSIRR